MAERSSEVWIEVPGVPVPQGSHRRARGRIVDDNPKLARWRRDVAMMARFAMRSRKAFDEPVWVLAEFRFPRPKCPLFPQDEIGVKPDLDKLQRAIGDALEKARVLVNDSRIARWSTLATYAGEPGVTLCVLPAPKGASIFSELQHYLVP